MFFDKNSEPTSTLWVCLVLAGLLGLLFLYWSLTAFYRVRWGRLDPGRVPIDYFWEGVANLVAAAALIAVVILGYQMTHTNARQLADSTDQFDAP